MFINKTDEAEKRKDIISRLDKNMLIEAGAGAGKTSIVIARNLEQLKSGRLKAEELVDITFTNAAAEELRSRLLKALHKEAENPALSEAEKERIEAAIRDESLIQISTIHSFCKRLLTEQSFAARLPMGVMLLDDAEAYRKKSAFFTAWYRSQDTKEMKELESEFWRTDSGKFIFDTFMEICELPEDTVFHYDASRLDPGRDRLSDYQTKLACQVDQWMQVILRIAQEQLPDENYSTLQVVFDKAPTGGSTKMIKADYQKLNDALTDYRKEGSAAKWKALEKGYGDIIKKLNPFNSKVSKKKTKFDHEVAYSSFISQVDTENKLDGLTLYQNALIVTKALEARKAYREYCDQNRQDITNDALLQEALRLVKEDPEARRYFQSRFSCIYVDEFQDTDLVQKELVELLCQDPDNPGKLRDGALFFVGDPKQSIYSFRGADPDVYRVVKNQYADAANQEVEEYILDNNYRSEKNVIDWVNEAYQDFGGGIEYSPMIPQADNPEDADVISGVYKLLFPKFYTKGDREKLGLTEPKYSGKAPQKKVKESRLLTTIIRTLCNSEGKYKIWDSVREKGEDGKEIKSWVKRPIRYDDFLVLCYKKDDLNIYAGALKKAGIPTNLCGAVDNENDAIVLRAVQLFKGLTYPGDRAAVHGAKQVLMGARITRENEREARARFDLLWNETKNKNGSELLQYIAHHPEYILTEEQTGEAVLLAQSRLQQMLEAIQAQPLGDRRYTFRLIEGYMTTGSDRELSLNTSVEAVRLMNLHKAKGLEGKIVFVCARSVRKEKASNTSYRRMKEYYPTASSKNGKATTKIPAYDSNQTVTDLFDSANIKPISELVTQKEKDEFRRLDYVETTRAEEALIFMDALAENSKTVFNNYPFESAKCLLDVSEELKTEINKVYDDKDETTSDERTKVPFDPTKWDYSITEDQKTRLTRSITPSGMEGEEKEEEADGSDEEIAVKTELQESRDDEWDELDDIVEAEESVEAESKEEVTEAEKKEKKKTWAPGPEPERPYGNIFGNVMHRSFEILVKKLRRKESYDVLHIVRQSMMENYMDIAGRYKPETLDTVIKQYEEYLQNRLSAFLADRELMAEVMSDDAEVYTEVPFSLYATQDEILATDRTLENVLKNRFPLEKGGKYWINGKADLVIVTGDRKVHIVDYKSDHIGSETMERFHEHLSGTYDNQQELYRFTLSKMFGIPASDISYRYYHMYMERESGE